MQNVATTIFSALRQMDCEADTLRDSHPTGLSWYAAHSRPELKMPRTEPEWSKRLATLLTQQSWATVSECRYPVASSRQKCDLVITLPDKQGKLWLEVKGAWKHYWLQRNGERIYRSCLFHPLLPDLDESKTHTAALDLEKLKSITREHGSHIGLLLIGFDGADSMLPDVQEFEKLAAIHLPPWSSFKDQWRDQRRENQSIHCWLWIRSLME